LDLVPFDDADDDDRPVGGMPLPPDDRLWRHPSELGVAATSAGTGVASATEGPNTKVWAVAVVAGLIGSALSLGVVAVAGGFSSEVVEKPVTQQVTRVPIAEWSVNSSGQSVIAVSKSVAPSITHIEGTVDNTSVVGSGIVIRDDGYVATNAHLVAHMTNVQIALADGTTLPGKVVGSDPTTDIAVVKIDRDHLAVATLGSATDLQSGETAIAIGAPIGSAGGPTVTVGVISAIGRLVSGRDEDLHDMIQTDAPIADGSTGGALCDSSGSVIGMTTGVADAASATGLGYAVPVDIVRAIVDDIIATGAARHAWLGVEGADLDTTNAHAMGVTGGAKVTKVMDNSPAASAGVQSDDVITSVNGVKVSSMAAFIVALRSHHPGDAITIEIVRSSAPQALSMTITLGERDHA